MKGLRKYVEKKIGWYKVSHIYTGNTNKEWFEGVNVSEKPITVHKQEDIRHEESTYGSASYHNEQGRGGYEGF